MGENIVSGSSRIVASTSGIGEKSLLRDSTVEKFTGEVVSLGRTNTVTGTAVHYKESLLTGTPQKPFILLIEDGEMHELDINPDIFYIADAILMKKGNVAAHISGIAREMRIPALAGVPIEKISEGASLLVRIGDEKGIVEILCV